MIKFEIRKNTRGREVVEVVHKCPFCSGLIYYDIDSKSVSCPYCNKSLFIVKTITSVKDRILYHKETVVEPEKPNLPKKENKPPNLFSLFGWRW
jgi:DNA-directed RNA polymerase subunit RPC12/RpoP